MDSWNKNKRSMSEIYVTPNHFTEDFKRQRKMAIELVEQCKSKDKGKIHFRVNSKTTILVSEKKIQSEKQRMELIEKYNGNNTLY